MDGVVEEVISWLNDLGNRINCHQQAQSYAQPLKNAAEQLRNGDPTAAIKILIVQKRNAISLANARKYRRWLKALFLIKVRSIKIA